MNTTEPTVPVFKSKSPEELAHATNLLEDAEIPYMVDSELDWVKQFTELKRRSYTILGSVPSFL